MKKFRLFLPMLCFLLLTLCACEKEPVSTSVPSSAPTTAPTEPVWAGYVSPKEDYVFYYEDGRDYEWEEDVLYFANSYLSDHLMLRNRQFLVQLPNYETDAANFYDAELHQQFLSQINALIPEISQLTDEQILYRLQMILSQFHDVHTRLEYFGDAFFPILFMPFNEQGETVFYSVFLPEAHEELLYCRLTAINGCPIDEVIEKMRAFACYENEYGLIDTLASGGYGADYFTHAFALEAVGICQPDADQAVYTLEAPDGTQYELTLSAVESFTEVDCVGMPYVWAYGIPFNNFQAESYWYTTELAEDTLYVRLNRFDFEENETYLQFAASLFNEYQAHGAFDQIIVDPRGNGGGYQTTGFNVMVSELAKMECEEFYILVDGGTYSCSLIFSAELEYHIPDAIFVGTPTGQAPCFLGAIYYETMPNCGVTFIVPSVGCQPFPACEENALVPDILLYPTLEDYAAGQDTVLNYLLAP